MKTFRSNRLCKGGENSVLLIWVFVFFFQKKKVVVVYKDKNKNKLIGYLHVRLPLHKLALEKPKYVIFCQTFWRSFAKTKIFDYFEEKKLRK